MLIRQGRVIHVGVYQLIGWFVKLKSKNGQLL